MTTRSTYERGYCTYGAGLGIIMTDSEFPRPPRDVGNARTFGIPEFYEHVGGVDPIRVVRD